MKNYEKNTLYSHFIFLGNCRISVKKSKFTNDYQKQLLGNIMGLNRLELSASFDECGEWGGHHEKFDIYRENSVVQFLDADTIDEEIREDIVIDAYNFSVQLEITENNLR